MWTKNGSIPQAETDGTDGWIEVADKPECPEGKDVVWLNWEWVIRDPKPDDRDGYRWKWNHDEYKWIEYILPNTITQEIDVLASSDINVLTSYNIESISSEQIAALTTNQISAL